MSGGGMSGADGAQPRDPGTDAPRAQRFVGRTALVTGASSGIGAGVARRLAAEGATVILLGRDESRLAQVRASLTGQDRAHRTVTAELGDPASITAAAQAVRDAGELHVLVHSAGVFGPQPFAEISVETLDRVWAVNVRAPFLLTQALLPMLRRGSAIVFVSSVSGRVGMIGQSAYGTSKSAVDGLARTLAVELAPDGIRVNAIAPGYTATPINAHLRAQPGRTEQLEAAILAGRLGQVDDIAASIAFLASDEAAFVHGITLAVDGGYPTSHIQTGRPA